MKKKVIIVSHGMRIGGVERSLIGLLEALDLEKYEVTLFLYEHQGEFLNLIPSGIRLLPENKKYFSLLAPIKTALLGRNFLIGFARLIARVIFAVRCKFSKQSGFLLSLSHSFSQPFLPRIPGEYDLAISFLMPHDTVWRQVTAKKKVGWIHTDYSSVETGVHLPSEEPAWAAMDKIVAVSKELANSFAATFPALKEKLVVIENILAPQFVRAQAGLNFPPTDMLKEEGVFVLCSAGRYTHQKAFDLAALACRKLIDAGMKVRWYILGYGPDEPLLRKLISENKLEDSFILLGKRTNPYPYMQACDLYVQPSRHEGKAVAVREAQMLGKPVLISDFATAGSQLEHNVDGYITEAGVDGLVRGIQLLAKDAGLRHHLAATAASRDYGNLAEVEKVYNFLE
jgi:glycosyltransferase involved in cell wall biosynthesis